MKKSKVAILVIVLAAACEAGDSCYFALMDPGVQDGSTLEQVTTPARAPGR